MTTDPLPFPAPGAPRPHSTAVIPSGVESVAVSTEAARSGLLQFHEAAVELGVMDTEPDWTDGRYRVYAALSEADCIRYGQGERYDFCISRRHHNYYHRYRAQYNSSYYFVYDGACSPLDKTHVTVVAARPDGSQEFTYANNSEDYDTRCLRNDLNRFLATKPGLEQAKALFTCQPLTPDEMGDVQEAQAAHAGRVAFGAITPTQQLMFVRLGNPLTDAEYGQAPTEVREAYISRAHLLTDQQARCSTEPQRRRSAQLFQLFNVTERLRTAAWLQRYPPPTPAMVAAHHTPQWPSKADDPVAWRSRADVSPLPPVMEDGNAGAGPVISGPYGSLCLTRLQRAVASHAPALVPAHELRESATGASPGPVIIAREGPGYVVLTGNAQVVQAKLAGDIDLVVRLATRANLAYARFATTGLD